MSVIKVVERLRDAQNAHDEDVEAGQAVQQMAHGGPGDPPYQEAKTRAWPPEPSS
jgi:hypothetical protein